MPSTIWTGEQSFTAVSATETVVAIKIPHRGELARATLTQASGTNAGFTAGLYTSNQETAPNSNLPASVFHLHTFTAANSTAFTEENDLNLPYLNRDGTPTNPQRFLYLKITPAGSGTKTFVFSVTVKTPKL